MIRFFRTIRKKLLTENKAGKYLIYAIGEILLVVIGIIIAVQIGNWNQSVQNEKLVRISLENLREDLEIQKEIIDEQISFEYDMLAQADTALILMQNPSPPIADLSRLFFTLSSRRTFVANKATFNNLEATGNIVLIQDKELKNELIRYYQQLDYTTAVITNNNLFLIDNIFGAFFANNGMKFGLNPDGSMPENHSIDPEERYTITTQLSSRKSYTESLLNISELQLTSTQKLINRINKTLNDRPQITETSSISDD
jgi:hypothetical protein